MKQIVVVNQKLVLSDYEQAFRILPEATWQLPQNITTIWDNANTNKQPLKVEHAEILPALKLGNYYNPNTKSINLEENKFQKYKNLREIHGKQPTYTKYGLPNDQCKYCMTKISCDHCKELYPKSTNPNIKLTAKRNLKKLIYQVNPCRNCPNSTEGQIPQWR